ncbi:MAG: hypothetical protein WBQ25_03630 [Nitrososphaeraceae archaeon]
MSPPLIIYSLKSFFKIGFVTIQISPTKIGSATAEQLIELQKSPADEFGVKHEYTSIFYAFVDELLIPVRRI